MGNLIRDGYTMSGYIAAQPGLNDAIEFEFRPVLSKDVYALDGKLQKATLEQRHDLLSAMLAKQLVSWSETQDNGEPWPITAQTVACLPFGLFLRMADIVRLIGPSDAVPASDDERQELEQLLEDTSPEATLRGN